MSVNLSSVKLYTSSWWLYIVTEFEEKKNPKITGQQSTSAVSYMLSNQTYCNGVSVEGTVFLFFNIFLCNRNMPVLEAIYYKVEKQICSRCFLLPGQF